MNSVYLKLYEVNPEQYKDRILEELFELGAAFMHYRDSKISFNELLDEIADVKLQIDKLEHWLSDFDIDNLENLRSLNKKTLAQKMINLVMIAENY